MLCYWVYVVPLTSRVLCRPAAAAALKRNVIPLFVSAALPRLKKACNYLNPKITAPGSGAGATSRLQTANLTQLRRAQSRGKLRLVVLKESHVAFGKFQLLGKAEKNIDEDECSIPATAADSPLKVLSFNVDKEMYDNRLNTTVYTVCVYKIQHVKVSV